MRLVQNKSITLTGALTYKAWLGRHMQLASFLGAFFVTLTMYFFLKIWSTTFLVLLIFPAVVSIIYPITFRFSKNKYFSVRMWPGVKLFIIAIVWSYCIVLMPNALYGKLSLFIWFDFFAVLLLVAGLTIPFDVRDMHIDTPDMRTLPHILGEEKALQISRFLLGIVQLYAVLVLLLGAWGWLKAISFLLGLEIGLQLIRKMRVKKDELYTAFWIEGVPIFIFLLYWMMKTLVQLL